MARKFLTPIDLSKNELQNGVIQNLGSAPSSPVKGQIYMNSTDNTLYWYDGAQFIAAKAAAGATPAATVTTQAVGDAPVVGVSTNFAREDHKHGREAFGVITAQTAFGAASGNGAAVTLARSDHVHGTPVHDNAAHAAITLNSLAPPTAIIDMNNQMVANVTVGGINDAVNKQYVDNKVNGLSWKAAARCATTANITLAGTQAIDGITPLIGQSVLVKNQTLPAENGLYAFNFPGAWTRAVDMDIAAEVPGSSVYVTGGTTQADTSWAVTSPDSTTGFTLGTTAITWGQVAGPGSITAGSGLTQSGNTINVGAGTGITVASDTVALDTTYTDGLYLNSAGGDSWSGVLQGSGAGTKIRVNDSTDALETYHQGTGIYWTGTGGIGSKGYVAMNGPGGGGTYRLAVQNAVAIDLNSPIITLSQNPAAAMEAVTKQYADAQVVAMAKKFAANVAAATSTLINHALNSKDVTVNVYRVASPFDTVECDVERTDVNNVTVRFSVAPAAGDYRVVVTG